MTSTRRQLLDNYLEIQFACVDMNLYLDNNPEDKNAICTYNKLCSQLAQAKCAYESKYGPLMNFGHAPSKYPWQWVCDPWPWDNEFYS